LSAYLLCPYRFPRPDRSSHEEKTRPPPAGERKHVSRGVRPFPLRPSVQAWAAPATRQPLCGQNLGRKVGEVRRLIESRPAQSMALMLLILIAVPCSKLKHIRNSGFEREASVGGDGCGRR